MSDAARSDPPNSRLEDLPTDTLMLFALMPTREADIPSDDAQRRALSGPSFAWRAVRSYWEGAQRQQERLHAADRDWREIVADVTSLTDEAAVLDRFGDQGPVLGRLWVERHLLVVCLDQVARNLAVATDRNEFPSARAAYARHQPTLESVRALRNHFEHVDERWPGRDQDRHFMRTRIVATGTPVEEWGWPHNARGEITISGTTWNVGDAGMEQFAVAVEEIESALRHDALKMLGDRLPSHPS